MVLTPKTSPDSRNQAHHDWKCEKFHFSLIFQSQFPIQAMPMHMNPEKRERSWLCGLSSLMASHQDLRCSRLIDPIVVPHGHLNPCDFIYNIRTHFDGLYIPSQIIFRPWRGALYNAICLIRRRIPTWSQPRQISSKLPSSFLIPDGWTLLTLWLFRSTSNRGEAYMR